MPGVPPLLRAQRYNEAVGRWTSWGIVAGLIALVPSVASADAFATAQGYGAAASGGRGGAVIKVTTLDPTGPGSLQEALSTPGPRIVVFDVSGVITADELIIPHGDITIAGQTAPGAGITIAGRLSAAYEFGVDNIILQHIRVRLANPSGPGEQLDALQLSRCSTVILDHVSVSFGVDETIDFYEASNVTVQWSTIEQAATMGHPEGSHNYGIIQGPDGARGSYHHNLFAHNSNRNPALASGPSEVRNNVVYNVRHGFVHHNPAQEHFSITGNYYKAGGDDDLFPFFFDDEGGGASPTLQYFLAGNYIEDPGVFEGTVDNPWTEPWVHPSFEYLNLDESYRADADLDFSTVDPEHVAIDEQPAETAYSRVLACAGAWPRDAITRRSIDDTEAGTGVWGAMVPADLLEGLTPEDAPLDSDGDGMPDEWESAHGLDPQDGTDHSAALDGYTAIEIYLADRSAAIMDPACSETEGGGETGGETETDSPTDGSDSAQTSDGSGPGSSAGGTENGSDTADSDSTTGSSPTSGGPTTTMAATDTDPVGSSDDSDAGGCGCQQGSAPATSLLALLALFGLPIRRRAREAEPQRH